MSSDGADQLAPFRLVAETLWQVMAMPPGTYVHCMALPGWVVTQSDRGWPVAFRLPDKRATVHSS